MNYTLIMLLKSEDPNPKHCTLWQESVSWEYANLFLDSLALQGHNLKNVALYNPDSKSLRLYKVSTQYWIESEVSEQITLEKLPEEIEFYKRLFNMCDVDTTEDYALDWNKGE